MCSSDLMFRGFLRWCVARPEYRKLVEQADSYRSAIAAGHEINIHFHTFEPDQMRRLLAAANDTIGIPARIHVLETHERFSSSRPDGFLIIARVEKPEVQRSMLERIKDSWRPAASALKPDARRF